MNPSTKSYLIGIAGGSASGKTHFLKSLRDYFNEDEVCIISQDNYYRPVHEQITDENGIINFDLPEGVDEVHFLKDVESLSNNIPVQIQQYMFNQPGVQSKILILKPAQVIVVEGIFIFHFPAIREILNYKVFMDSNEEIKLARRLQRDVKERGVQEETILYQWHNHVIPAYNKYLLPYLNEADIIIDNNDNFEEGFDIIKNHIKQLF